MPTVLGENTSWLTSNVTRQNNFDLIRLFAALQVVLLHSSGHTNVVVSPRFFDLMEFFAGVPIFFFLSGMLVTHSLTSSRSVQEFYAKRVRRVFPALWLACGVALLLLVYFGQLTTHELRLPSFWLWLVTQLSFLQFYNPEMFRDFGTGVVNGSLWTISVEVGFYAILPFIVALAGKISNPKRVRTAFHFLVIALISASYLLFAYLMTMGNLNSSGPKAPVWVLLLNQTFLPHLWLFGLGMLAYAQYDLLKKMMAYPWILLSIYLCVSLIGTVWSLFGLPVFYLGSRLLLCATVFSLGACTPPVAEKWLHGWDLSYGLYVFHMLVVNAFIASGMRASWWSVLAIILTALGIAALSWRFVERPSIRKRGWPLQISWKRGNSRETVAW